MNTEQLQAALPGYEIGNEIGRGGCGVVLAARHDRLQRQVAIKQIPPQFAKDPDIRNRFIAEARLMAAIDHPHVVAVHDYIEHEDLCLLVMEYLPGGTVADRFATEGFDAASALAVTLACTAGLQAAHHRGVLHRDIKPANLIFAADGTVKLTDFGIAKIVGGDETLVTRAGEIVGTPSYIAPEQARGQKVSPATDVYAVATMLYQLLSGVLPFPTGEDSIATLFMHAFEQPTPLLDVAPRIPEPVVDVVMRGLATDPTERFNSAEAFGVALGRAAAAHWGDQWLDSSGIPVTGSATIVAAATGTHRQQHAATAPPERPGGATTQATVGPSLVSPTRVRPVQTLTRPRIELADVSSTDLAPVQDVLKYPSPRAPFLVAGLLALAGIVLAVVGWPVAANSGDLRPGMATVASQDPAASDVLDIDMSKPIPVTISGVEGDRVALALNVLDTPVKGHWVPLIPTAQGLVAEAPPPINPHILAGRTTAELTVFHGETVTASYRFGVRSTQSPLPTAVTAATAIVGLFAAAYCESYFRALRRGRSRFLATICLPLSAAALITSAVAAAWVLMGVQPTPIALTMCAILGLGAGVSATVGAHRVGRKHRYRRSQARSHRP